MVCRIFRQGCVHRPQPYCLVRQSPAYNRLHLVRIEALQGKYSAARKQRSDNFKRRVLGSCADKRDGAIFNMRQNHVLLGLIEPVNLVHEQDGRLTVHAFAVLGLSDDTAQIGHSGSNGANRLKINLGRGCHQPGQCRLASAWWPPEDDGRQASYGNGFQQHSVRVNDLVLPDKIGKGPGPHPLCQRGVVLRLYLAVKIEQ